MSAYGKGKELSGKEWASVFRQLVAMGHLAVDVEGHGSLLLTPTGLAVLGQQETVRLRKDPLPHKERKRKRLPAASAAMPDGPDAAALWEALRTLRRALADEAAVPAYVIFPDATLREMLTHRPQTLEALGRLSGIGERKLARYGEAFLELLHGFAGDDAPVRRVVGFAEE